MATLALCLGVVAAVAGSATASVSPADVGTVTFTSQAPADAVVGGPSYTPTATSPAGAVVFSVDPATTNAACTVSNGIVLFAHAGSCVIDAEGPPYGAYTSANGAQQTITVAPAGTTASLVVGATALTATVAAAAPGGGTPAGIVQFSVEGRALGSSSLVDGVATLDYSVPANVTETILASYQGEQDYTSSSAAVTVNGPSIEPTFVAKPTIAAVLTSSVPRNRRGWWRAAVRVHFICNGAGSAILGGCPQMIVLDRSGSDLSLSRTIHTVAGRSATVTLRGLKIDLTRPRVWIVGVHHHALAHGGAAAVRCAASDRISGIASCRLRKRLRRGATRESITYTAVAISGAGVVARVRETAYARA